MFLVRSGAFNGYERLVLELGGNPVQLIDTVGLSQAQFRDPDTYISYSKVAELLEITAIDRSTPLFGLLLARRQSTSVLGDLPLLLSQSDTVGDSLASINRYLYLHARGVHLQQQTRGDEVELGLGFDIASPRGLNQLILMSTAHLANFSAEMLNKDKYSLPLFLQQEAPERLDSAKNATPYRLRFGAEADCIRFPSRWLDKKIHRNEQALNTHLQEYLRRLQHRYPDNLQDQVRDIVSRILASGECSVERVAATLDLHPRVLQKRLKKQHSSYGKLLRQTRMEIAQQQLRRGSMGVTDLALHLGYADVSIFSRNFKQWTGMSPSIWQKKLADERSQ